MRTIFYITATMVSTNLMVSTPPDEVSVPDAGLNVAIREALQKPGGPLTQQDLLTLTNLSACCRNISNLEGLQAARNLQLIDLHSNSLTNFAVASALTNLKTLNLFNNRLTDLVLPNAMPNLTFLDLGDNQLLNLTLPPGLTNLASLFLAGNQLIDLRLPPDLIHVVQLDLGRNNLTRLTLPAGMTNLSVLTLDGNQLTIITLPPDMMKLGTLTLTGNPLTFLVLSEPLAATRLAGLVTSLPNQGVTVFTYPLAVVLLKPDQTLDNDFAFTLAGPPGIYTVLGSTNLAAWSVLSTAINEFGSVLFTDPDANLSPQKFYHALLQNPPPPRNRVLNEFITQDTSPQQFHRVRSP